MFIHQSQLVHLLPPSAYYDADHYQTELTHIFAPGWHAVCTLGDIPHDGDFITLSLLGRPILLRNNEGRPQAYLNVCSHRHAALTCAEHGSMPVLRCQYHGWEYKPDGRTGKIPDARCFRPFDRERAHLKLFRTERVGQLVFVSLAEEGEGPSIGDYLGADLDYFEAYFPDSFRHVVTWVDDIACNWKIPVENSTESYHLAMVHAKTFGNPPDEERIHHQLSLEATRYQVSNHDANLEWLIGRISHRLGFPPHHLYTHYLRHPNLATATTDIVRMVQVCLPTGPRTCQYRTMLYALRGFKKSPYHRFLGRLVRKFSADVARTVLNEDKSVFPSIQQGMEQTPYLGVIGTREERIYVFQRWLAETCRMDLPELENAPPVNPASETAAESPPDSAAAQHSATLS